MDRWRVRERLKVLMAEDEASSRKLLGATLARWGYEVIEAKDGEEALAVLEKDDAPRLAILDRRMPKLDGVEVTRRVRARERADPIYVVLLTAMGRKSDVVEGLKAGADDYVTKPFDTEELKARLKVGERIVKLQADLADRVVQLEDALAHIQTLQGIIPICMHCHRIRDDEEVWQRIDNYLEQHSEARFSHGLCPACLDKHYPEAARRDL